MVFTAGGLGLPPVYPIMREHLRAGNHVTLIAGFRSADLLFWTGDDERVAALQREFGDLLEVVYTTNDGTFGVEGFVTTPLEEMLEAAAAGTGPGIAEVVAIGPPLMMRAVSDLTRRFGVPTVASLNSIMVDATGMCGACMVPVTIDGKSDPQARVHRRPGDRRAHHRVGQVPAPLRPVPRPRGAQPHPARSGLICRAFLSSGQGEAPPAGLSAAPRRSRRLGSGRRVVVDARPI